MFSFVSIARKASCPTLGCTTSSLPVQASPDLKVAGFTVQSSPRSFDTVTVEDKTVYNSTSIVRTTTQCHGAPSRHAAFHRVEQHKSTPQEKRNRHISCKSNKMPWEHFSVTMGSNTDVEQITLNMPQEAIRTLQATSDTWTNVWKTPQASRTDEGHVSTVEPSIITGLFRYRRISTSSAGLAHNTTPTSWLARLGIQKEFPNCTALSEQRKQMKTKRNWRKA